MSPETMLKTLVSTGKTPGIVYVHFGISDVVYQFADGFANIVQKVKVGDQTVFHACSVTKTFTALGILQLEQKGILKIDDLVKYHWPEFPYPGNITIHHLLSHTAGIPNPIPLKWIHLEPEHSSFDKNSFFKSIFEKHKNLRSHPNEKFFYSNLGYVLLGMLIEYKTGSTYEQFIRKNILDKLGLEPGELGFEPDSKFYNAVGYQKNISFMNLLLGFFLNKTRFMDQTVDGWKAFKPFYINGSAYGGLIGSPQSFMRYGQELLKRDSALINEELKKSLFTENLVNSGKQTGMCLSWFCGVFNGRKYFAHPGGGGGYYCELRLYPEINKGSIIMFNRTGMSNEKFLDKIDQFFIV